MLYAHSRHTILENCTENHRYNTYTAQLGGIGSRRITKKCILWAIASRFPPFKAQHARLYTHAEASSEHQTVKLRNVKVIA